MGAVARTALSWVGVWVARDSLSERTGAAAHKQQPEPPQHMWSLLRAPRPSSGAAIALVE